MTNFTYRHFTEVPVHTEQGTEWVPEFVWPLWRSQDCRLNTGVPYCQNAIWFDCTHVNVISFTAVRKAQPSLCDFHETHKLSAAPCADVYRTAVLGGITCRSCGQKCTYASKYSKSFNAQIFTKFLSPQRHYVAIPYAKFHPNPSRNMESTDTSTTVIKTIFTKETLA